MTSIINVKDQSISEFTLISLDDMGFIELINIQED